MFTLGFSKTTRMIVDRILGRALFEELSTPGQLGSFNNSHEDFMNRVHRTFTERGYQELNSESALDEQYLLFTRNDILHLVYCLPYETYVTTIEIQACWEARCRLGAHSSSIAAPYRFSQAARHKAESLAIELLPVDSSERCVNTNQRIAASKEGGESTDLS